MLQEQEGHDMGSFRDKDNRLNGEVGRLRIALDRTDDARRLELEVMADENRSRRRERRREWMVLTLLPTLVILGLAAYAIVDAVVR
jgi:hypothetical protein